VYLIHSGTALPQVYVSIAILDVYFAASVLTFFAYAFDNSAAQNNRWRTQESTLPLLEVGGWLRPWSFTCTGNVTSQVEEKEFQIVFWATIIINCFTLGWLLTKSGSAFLSTILASQELQSKPFIGQARWR